MVAKERFPGSGPFFKVAPQTHTTSAMCDLLHHGRIVEYGLIPWGSNYTFLVLMDVGQSAPLLGVYKPRRGEAPLWDFPDGTLYKREFGAFLLSEALGWSLVPPTVIRDGPKGVGTVQLYVHHRAEDADYFAIRDQHIEAVKAMATFDLIANNTDRKAGHCLRDEYGHVWGIDHGLTFHEHPKLRTVIWEFGGEPIPEPLLRDIRQVYKNLETHKGVTSELAKLLASSEMNALKQRMQYLLAHPEFPALQTRRGVPWSFY